MNSKTFFDNFKTIANAPGGIGRLRELILDLAVRGRLLDEHNSIFHDESEILSKWRSETLDEAAEYIQRGKGPRYAEKSDVAVVSQKCVKWSGFDISEARFIDTSSLSGYKEDRFLRSGDLLWNSTGTGTVGRTALFHEVGGFSKVVADSHVTVIRAPRILPRFLWIWSASPSIQTEVLGSTSGSTNQQELNLSTIKGLVIAIPPMDEQERIVARVDELMGLCDELEAAQNRRNLIRTAARKSAIDAISTASSPEELDVAWKRISGNWLTIADTPESIASLRSLILDLAMKGELVPKSSEWRECLLGEITRIRTGKLDANASSPDGVYPFFTCARDPLRISSFSYDTECVLLAGNGNFDVNYYSGKFDAYQRTYILEARDRAELSIPFLYRFMQGHSRKLLEQSIGGVIKYIKIGFLTEAKFLLPQMEEQKMIVSKVDELMELCDQLENSLIKRDELAKKIAGSLASEIAA
jgi:restriction endonuclease S subunit